MPAFGSSAKWLRGPVAGSASKKKANPGQGYDAPRKSFFQSLDPEERAALLKVAPSLRCAGSRRSQRLSSFAAAFSACAAPPPLEAVMDAARRDDSRRRHTLSSSSIWSTACA